MFVKKDGTVYGFCSGKCKKNSLNLKREGRRQKWTIASRKFKEMQARKKAAPSKEETAGKKAKK